MNKKKISQLSKFKNLPKNKDINEEDIPKPIHFSSDFEKTQKEAQNNHSDAQYELGLIYFFEKNFNEAQYWLQKALSQNKKDALYYLAMIEKNGYIDSPNMEKYFSYLKEGSDIKNINCTFEIAKCYLNGIGVEKNTKEAFRHFLYAAINQHPVACYYVGEFYLESDIVEKDYEEAYNWFSTSYQNKYPPALYQLSILTLQGLGTEQDIETGISGLIECQKQNIKAAAAVLDFLRIRD